MACPYCDYMGGGVNTMVDPVFHPNETAYACLRNPTCLSFTNAGWLLTEAPSRPDDWQRRDGTCLYVRIGSPPSPPRPPRPPITNFSPPPPRPSTPRPSITLGSVRLVDGANFASGRLEVLVNGSWTTVCADLFGALEATVACRNLGFVDGRPRIHGGGTSKSQLVEVDCSGVMSTDEEGTGTGPALQDCKYAVTNAGSVCSHDKDVGVTCQGPRPPPSPPTASLGGSSEANDLPLAELVDCVCPSTWCSLPGSILQRLDCDGDGYLDCACRNRMWWNNQARGAILSTHNCKSSDDQTGWPDAPQSTCPAAFGCPAQEGFRALRGMKQNGFDIAAGVPVEDAFDTCLHKSDCVAIFAKAGSATLLNRINMLIPDQQDACLYYKMEYEAVVSAAPSQALPEAYAEYRELFDKFLPQYNPVTEAPNYLFVRPGERCPLDASGCTATRRCVGLSPLAYFSQSMPRSCDQLWSPSRSFLFQIWSTIGEFVYFKEQGKEKSQVSFGMAFDTNQDGVYGFGFNEFPANAYRLNPDGVLSVHGCWKRTADGPFGYTIECEEDPMMTSVGFGRTTPENSGTDNAPFLLFLTDLGDIQIVNRHGRVAWSFNGVPPVALQPIQWTLSASARSSFLGDKFEAQCPDGAFVTGWSGLVWADVPSIEPCLADVLLSHPAGPLLYQALASYTRDNKLYVGYTMRCSDGSSVGVAKRSATSTVTTSDLLYTTDIRSANWVEPPCPGGYDQVRFQASPFSRVFDQGYVTVRPLARCAATGKWTLYTAGLGFAAQEPAASSNSEPFSTNATSSLFAAIAAKCGAGAARSSPEYYDEVSLLIGNMAAATPYRSADHLGQLQAQARLEDLAGGVSCPPGQVLTGFFGKRMAITDRYRDYVLHSSMFPGLSSSVSSAELLDAFDELGLVSSDLAGPGDGLSVTSLDGVFCAALPVAATATQQAVESNKHPPSAAASGAPDLGDDGAMYLATALPAGSVPASYATTTLGCDGAQITSLYSASNGVDITLIGVRCSDGRGESAGSYQPKLLESGNPGYVLDHACPQGYDAIKSSPGMGWDGLRRGQGISSLSFRCSAAASSHDGLDPDSDGRFWVQLGAAPVLVVNSTMFAASEVFVNNPQTWRCPNDTVVSKLVVHYTQGGQQGATLWRVHIYCSARPPPARDSSWFDIAARYGITLTDLLRSNPHIDSTKLLAAYNDTDVRVPQLCGAAATQPPVSTISSECSKWWPTRNITVTGSETCGTIATSYLSRNLLYLNTINNGVCPQASTVINKGMRLCIAPPSAVLAAVTTPRGAATAAAAGHRRRRGLLQADPSAAAAGGTCVLSSWVSVGQTCDDICTMYNLDLGVFLRYNRGLDCASLSVGMEVCVAVAPAGTARFRQQQASLDDDDSSQTNAAYPHTPPSPTPPIATPAGTDNSSQPPPPSSSKGGTRKQRPPPPRRSAARPPPRHTGPVGKRLDIAPPPRGERQAAAP